MNSTNFQKLAANYPSLRIAVIGDFCLDRYLEVDFSKREVSIETGLPVYNVVNVRSQPGAAGTVLSNLVALGVGEIYAAGFAGEDGEGWELCRALRSMPRVNTDFFIQTPERRTFTYTKPLVVKQDKPPKPMHRPQRNLPPPSVRPEQRRHITELNRLDFKNWTPTNGTVVKRLVKAVESLADKVDAFILLDQVEIPETGVLTKGVLDAIGEISRQHPKLLIMADSRMGLNHFPPVTFKMNGMELAHSLSSGDFMGLEGMYDEARVMANQFGQRVFITMAECGIIGATPEGEVEHAPAFPVRGQIDIVGAGDAVTANLVSALLAGASLRESLEIANAAASVVIHQLGTTGTAAPEQIKELLAEAESKA